MKLSFVGDVSFTGIYRLVDPVLSDNITNYLNSNDYNICNLEGPLTDMETVKDKNLDVKSPLNCVKHLTKNKFNICGLANNHIFDAGEAGFKDTVDNLRKNNIQFAGASLEFEQQVQPIYLEQESVKVAVYFIGHNQEPDFTNSSYGVYNSSHFNFKKEFEIQKRMGCDWIIVYSHDGPEYNVIPTPSVTEKYDKLIENGADVVIGHHSHTVQGSRKSKNKYIYYSLGNFLFDIKQHKNKSFTDLGLIIDMNLEKQSIQINEKLTRKNRVNGIVEFVDSNDNKSKHYKRLTKRVSSKRWLILDGLRVLFFNSTPLKNVINFFLFPIVYILKYRIIRGTQSEFFDTINPFK